eukprot:CAMPEP_0184484094 /NCGR_PEP_ID=MMETSP0113_2-20130426/5811_1 /TAXON_ID=91329 /ORGANISM="Norrisiella sphaerica, Strain BC52" /LENGTH=976 /DNA_ID=CAMNT_0026864905 /DNA_START=41 /DNA_END=2971 /DNA_ORIENTATION=+
MSEEVKIPPGIEPFSISMGQMEKLGLKSGEDITDIYEFKVYDKAYVKEDMEKNGFMSAFHNLRKKIEAYSGDKIFIVADLECTYVEMCNFFWCSTEETFKEYSAKFEEEMGDEDGKKGEKGKSKQMLVKYLAILRIDTEKKVDTLCHFASDEKKDEHKEIVELIVKDCLASGEPDIFGTRPYRKKDNDYCDYMAHGVKIDDENYAMESQLVVAAAFGKLFSNLAEPELALSLEKMFKYQAGIKADQCERAIYHEFDEKTKPHFEKVVVQFEDEADDPNEVIPEYVEIPLVAQKEWVNLTMEDVKNLDKNASPETIPERRSAWAFKMPTVEELKATNTRRLKKFFMSKPRREFAWDTMFEDVDEETTASFPRAENENFNFKRQDLDIGFQCAPSSAEASTQTSWARKINKMHQVVPRRYTPKEIEGMLSSKELSSFVKSKMGICKHFLQSNFVVDLFNDEFVCLADVESSVGKNVENNFKSMNQLRVPGMPPRRICDIAWHPTVKGMVAFACGANLDNDKLLELSGKVMWTSIIMWNLNNLLSPRLRLAVPGDVQCFKINKENPYLIVAGLETGQVIMWDLTEAQIDGEDVYATKKEEKAPPNNDNSQTNSSAIPSFACKATSVLQVSHQRPVSDLQWLPKGVTIDRKGCYRTDPDAKQAQFFATVATDGFMYFWDVKLKESHNADGSIDKNLRWGPSCKLPLLQEGAKVNLSGKKFAFLTDANDKTRLVVVTETGEMAFGNFAIEPAGEGGGGGVVQAVETLTKAHCLSCVAVQQSPHFPDICLTVGDWTFSIWKKGFDEPIFTSPAAEAYLTVGCWSPTRAGLIVVGRADGIMDIWILIDQIHKPVLHRTVRANIELTSIRFWNGRSSQQLLAIGDFAGTLHIFSVPRILMRPAPNEKRAMKEWYEHEVQRLAYVQKRKESRPAEKEDEKKDDKKEDKKRSEDEVLEEKEKEYQELLKMFREKLLPDEDDKKAVA